MEYKRTTPRIKRSIAGISAALLAASLLIVPGPANADEFWNHWTAAEAAETAGNLSEAAAHWRYLIDAEASRGEWNNAAVHASKLDRYLESAQQYDEAVRYYELENEYWTKAGNDWGINALNKAENLRSTMELYVSSGNALRVGGRTVPAGRTLAKFEPEYGAYFGIYSEQDPRVGNVFIKNKDVFGKKPALFLFYWTYGKDDFSSFIDRAKEAGGAVQIAFEPSGGLDEVADGPYLRKFARDLKAAGIPVFLRYAAEMNGAWVKWHGDPQKYIEKWRLIHGVLKEEGADNVAMVWSPGDEPISGMDDYYPGDDYVDWVGVSLYSSPYTVVNGEHVDNKRSSPVQWLDYVYRTYASRKPIMLSESGVSHYDNTMKEDFGEWGRMNLQRLFEVMPYKYPRLKAITYFNKDLPVVDQPTITRSNYMLDDTDALTDYVRGLLANPYLLSDVKQGARPQGDQGYLAAEGSFVVDGEARFVPFVKIPDVYIGKLDVLLNGQKVTSLTAPPYAFTLKASEIPLESTLELRAYAKDGRLAVSRSYTVSPETHIEIDGKPLVLKDAPLIRDGRTLAPVRAIFEAMGATVLYDDAAETVTGIKGAAIVSMRLRDTAATVNGEAVTLQAAPDLVNDRTMAPVRFVCEAFGGSVTWEGSTYTVKVKTEGK